jgi:hypothetical protein
MRILSLQLYTWIQPSSVPSHIVGCKLSASAVTIGVSPTNESDTLRTLFGSSSTPVVIPGPGVPSSPSSSSSLEELLEVQCKDHSIHVKMSATVVPEKIKTFQNTKISEINK